MEGRRPPRRHHPAPTEGEAGKDRPAAGGRESFLKQFTPPGARYDSVFEVLCVHAASRTQVTIFDLPPGFPPYDKVEGWDYWKIFVDDESYHEGHGQFYETFGVDREQGCTIIVRPDQYVSYLGPVDEVEALNHFFSAFTVPSTGTVHLATNMSRPEVIGSGHKNGFLQPVEAAQAPSIHTV